MTAPFLNHSCDKAEAYEEGRQAGLEDAAKICEFSTDDDIELKAYGKEFASKIRTRAKELK